MAASLKIVLVTCPNSEVSETIAETLISERLAACVNIVPVSLSVYEWEGKVCKEGEVLLIIKTVAENITHLETRIPELHPYSVPEFVVIDTEYVSEKYLGWALSQTNR